MYVLLITTAAEAGPWVREPGGVYAKAALSSFAGDESVTTTAGGSAQSAPLAYRDLSVSLYAEAGLPWGFQGSAYLPYVLAANDDGHAAFQSYSAGDAEIGLTRRVLRSPVAVALSAVAKVPMYADRADLRMEQYGAYSSRFPDPGDGQVDLDGRIEVGAGLPTGRLGAWVQGRAGYRYRFGEYVDGIPWSAQLGAAPRTAASHAMGWVGVEASGIVNLENDPATKSWTRLGAFAAVKLPNGLAIEAWAGAIPVATSSHTGGGGGVGLSWTREEIPAAPVAGVIH